MITDDSAITIEALEATPSTMDAARERVLDGRIRLASGLPKCACVTAREQTAGRGQRGRAWYAAPGESLCATYVFQGADGTRSAAPGGISLTAGVAVASELVRYHTPAIVGLKWPNDVLLGGRKVGGILVEAMRSPDGHAILLVGIGLNLSIAEFPPEIAGSATSLLLEGAARDRLSDTARIARDIGVALAGWSLQPWIGAGGVIEAWRRFDATTGRAYETELDGRRIAGTAAGISDTGALLLHTDDGSTIEVTSATSLRELAGSG